MAALIYWYNDPTPQCQAVPSKNLRATVTGHLIKEGEICEAKWTPARGAPQWLNCIVLYLDNGRSVPEIKEQLMPNKIAIAAHIQAGKKILEQLLARAIPSSLTTPCGGQETPLISETTSSSIVTVAANSGVGGTSLGGIRDVSNALTNPHSTESFERHGDASSAQSKYYQSAYPQSPLTTPVTQYPAFNYTSGNFGQVEEYRPSYRYGNGSQFDQPQLWQAPPDVGRYDNEMADLRRDFGKVSAMVDRVSAKLSGVDRLVAKLENIDRLESRLDKFQDMLKESKEQYALLTALTRSGSEDVKDPVLAAMLRKHQGTHAIREAMRKLMTEEQRQNTILTADRLKSSKIGTKVMDLELLVKLRNYIDQWASKRKIDIPEAAFRHAVSVYLQECKSKNKSAEKMKKQRIARMGSDCEGDSDSSKGKNENQQMLDNHWTDGFD